MFLKSSRDAAEASLLRALNPAIVVLGEKGNVIQFSAGAETLFGIRAAQVARLGFGQCIPCPKEYHSDLASYLRDYAENNPNLWLQPLIGYRYDGVRFPLVYRIACLGERSGQTVCEFLDASHYHELQLKTRHQLDDTLASSRAKSKFLHHMSQQFRTPINHLLGAISDVLDYGQLPGNLQGNLDQALLSGRDLQRSLNEMVDFTRLETDELEFQNISFNFRLVLEEIVDGFGDLAKRKGIELATLVSPYVPESVTGDPDRIHQILQSLLNNAFRHTLEGGVTVKAECQIENATHAVIDLEVSDTGEGMTEVRAQAIRAAFEKRDTSFVDRYGGLGIGLAISRELLSRMGGTLTLRSVEGLGTTFKISIKLPKGIDMVANQRQLGRHRILLVTDSVAERTKLLEYCGEWQLDVDTQGSSPLALEKLRQASIGGKPYELVIIDLHQHRLASLQFAQEIARNAAFDSSRVLMLIHDRDDLPSAEAERLRLDAVLLKPVRKQTLHDAIATVLGRDEEQNLPLVTDRTLQQFSQQNNKRALLVEDNEVNQIIAKGALKKLGIHADVTNNGEEAIEAVMEKRYDFILMDCEMPLMDGFEATRAIRAWEQEQGGHLPIIALTASDANDCHDACMDAGMDEYMQKPFRADQLEAILLKIESKPH